MVSFMSRVLHHDIITKKVLIMTKQHIMDVVVPILTQLSGSRFATDVTTDVAV